MKQQVIKDFFCHFLLPCKLFTQTQFYTSTKANIDGETDSFIQQMLRTRFEGTTLITIAHRLETIMDYDKVLVMADGRAAEIGLPYELIEKQGIFTDLVHATGEGAAVLIAMAKEASDQKKRLKCA
jgi:energy-coupling factor transporter ATP-binding protein EcfA2